LGIWSSTSADVTPRFAEQPRGEHRILVRDASSIEVGETVGSLAPPPDNTTIRIEPGLCN
jgi:hypothetical protein